MNPVEEALSAAIESIARLYERHPEPRPDVNGERWTELESTVSEAIARDDESGALTAIARWQRHAEEVLR